MKEKIIRILQELNEDISCDENVNLLSNGMIDSFDVANLVAELETDFAIEIDAEDIVPENFDTIAAIMKLIEKYNGV